MARNGTQSLATGRLRWPILLLLVAAVLVPTAGVLWFLNAAVRNERLAVRQRLLDVYEPPMRATVRAMHQYWRTEAAGLAAAARDLPPARAFARVAEGGAFDGAVFCEAWGRPLYPRIGMDEPAAAEWEGLDRPRRLEYGGSPKAAAEAYRETAEAATDPDLRARALVGQARCLARGGRTAEAVEMLAAVAAEPRCAAARDAAGRLLVPQAQLRALELMEGSDSELFAKTAQELAARLRDYAEPAMPSRQRRFLMKRLRELAPEIPAFPAMAAEDLAAAYLAADPTPATPGRWTPAGSPGLWQMGLQDGGAVALVREERLHRQTASLLESEGLPGGADARLLPPGAELAGEPLLALPAGQSLPGWTLALELTGQDPFAAAADRRVAVHVWTALLVLCALVAVGLAGGGYLRRQMKLARLKNDFIATVTHELKTPLAAVRMFAETLREGRYQDQREARRYLDLLVGENERLSRLIDNFLSFSRMERDKRAFALAELPPADLVQEAAEVVGERLRSDGYCFEVDLEPGLPPIMADRDALLTVLLNLLDNADKYGGEEKRVALRAYLSDGDVCLEVEDNGIGMSRREAKKVFDRFYQVDNRLSRRAGGCGLGLSIVKFIVDAHDGTVEIESEPGEGSTFTVRLPALQENA